MEKAHLKIGDVNPEIYKTGENETGLGGLKDGDVFWTVRMADESYYDTKSQDTAEILSQLVVQNDKLRKLSVWVLEK